MALNCTSWLAGWKHDWFCSLYFCTLDFCFLWLPHLHFVNQRVSALSYWEQKIPDTTSQHDSVLTSSCYFFCMIRLAPMQFICGGIKVILGMQGKVWSISGVWLSWIWYCSAFFPTILFGMFPFFSRNSITLKPQTNWCASSFIFLVFLLLLALLHLQLFVW